MKKYITLLVAFAALLVFPLHEVAAGSHYGNIPDATSVTTVGVGNITASSAVLKGHVSLVSNTSIDFAGFRFSLSSTCPDTQDAEEVRFETADAGNNYTATVKGLQRGTKYYFRAIVRINGQETCGEIMSFTTLVASPVPEGAVDLGIEMTRKDGTRYNLYWAKCNLGATKPEEYGNYYAWGETELKLDYSWATYKWFNGSYDTLTKYNTRSYRGRVDNYAELFLTDDVAHVKLGGKWRMPTDAEWTELRAKCIWTLTTQNGVKGYKVTASNGNSIFLPAAGYRDATDIYDAGSYGYYWSSSLETVYPLYALYVLFSSDYVSRYSNGRYYGRSVRPVSE